MEAIIIWWSKTGNTEKAALAIREGLEEAGAQVSLKRVEDASSEDYFSYDSVCIGFPSYQWSPPEPTNRFLKLRHRAYRKQGRVKLGEPRIPTKNALIFCTYSGPHTGIAEVRPAGLYAGQFLDHIGFNAVDEWCVVGEYQGSKEKSTKGRLGDIRGRPTQEGLRKVTDDARTLALTIMRE